MLQHSMVLETEVDHEGTVHRVSYFVENNVLHAHIAGRLLLAPLTDADPASQVRSLLVGHLMTLDRKAQQFRAWGDLPMEKE